MSFDEYLSKAVTKPEAKLTIVDAWATWCGPCKENFPHLVEMHKKYASKGLNVVSLSMDDPTDAAAVKEAKAFLEKMDATFTNVLLKEDFGVGFRAAQHQRDSGRVSVWAGWQGDAPVHAGRYGEPVHVRAGGRGGGATLEGREAAGGCAWGGTAGAK